MSDRTIQAEKVAHITFRFTLIDMEIQTGGRGHDFICAQKLRGRLEVSWK
jgi:hypothetical protein